MLSSPGDGDTIQSRRYEIWSRLSDIFKIEPQLPGTGGKFRLSTIVQPVINAQEQLWDNGFYFEEMTLSAGTFGVVKTAAVPSAEAWLVYNVTWIKISGDNDLISLRMSAFPDSGGFNRDIIISGNPGYTSMFANFGGGIRVPGGSMFSASMAGAGLSETVYHVTVWHQKMPESGLIPAPPYR